MILDIYI